MIVPLRSIILPNILLIFASHYIDLPSLINSPISDFIKRCNCRQRDWEDLNIDLAMILTHKTSADFYYDNSDTSVMDLHFVW